MTTQSSMLCSMAHLFSFNADHMLLCCRGTNIEKSLIWFGLVSLFIGISTFICQNHPCKRTVVVLFNLVDRGSHTFPKGISPKVSIKARLEFEFAYHGVTVQHIKHYIMRNPSDISYWDFVCTLIWLLFN